MKNEKLKGIRENATVKAETEKAVLLSDAAYSIVSCTNVDVWIPKSLISQKNGNMYVAAWFAKKLAKERLIQIHLSDAELSEVSAKNAKRRAAFAARAARVA